MLESTLIMIGRIISNSQNRFKNRTLTQQKIQDLWSFPDWLKLLHSTGHIHLADKTET